MRVTTIDQTQCADQGFLIFSIIDEVDQPRLAAALCVGERFFFAHQAAHLRVDV